MKKFLLGMIALGMCGTTAFAADPVFPTSFNITADSKTVVIENFTDEDEEDSVPMYQVTGTTTKDVVRLTVEVPEGWDGFVGGIMMRGGMKQSAPADWVSMDQYEAEMGETLQKGNVLEFPADGISSVGVFNLYVGDRVDVANAVMIAVKVDHVDAPDPVFPSSFNITADSPDINIDQEIDEDFGDYTIAVSGSTTKDKVTLTFEVPEGWDGFIGNVMMRGGWKEKAPAQWTTIEDYELEVGSEEVMKGNVFEFDADGITTVSMFYLYVDGKVDLGNPITMGVMVNHVDAPDPVFPEEFNVSTEYETVLIDQFIDEETGMYTIQASGTAPAETVDLTFDLPEGWDGLIGTVMMRGGFKQFAPADWMSMEDFETEYEGADIQKGTTLQFPADGLTSVCLYYLYSGDRVDIGNPIMLAVLVEHKTVGVASVETEENGVRYFNLYGVEVEQPESGIYVKVSGDKVEKIYIK